MFDVNLHNVSVDDVLSLIENTINMGERAIISIVNTHKLNVAYQNPWYRTFLNSNALVLPEGMMVKLGARILKQRLSGNFHPARWLPRLFEHARQHSYTFFGIGLRRGLESSAVNDLLRKNPSLLFAGIHHGDFNTEPGCDESETVVRLINEAQAKVLLMGFGTPQQEQWLEAHWDRIQVSVAIIGDSLSD
jgi:N-acetylglucosaminyldiphosphoundecaprenol N-acetyl-beta-D-mannosaminyltransferase